MRRSRVNKGLSTVQFSILLTMVVTIGCILILLWASFLTNYNIAQSMYASENRCIAYWIQQGVERSNIVRADGTCAIVTEYK